MVAKMARLIDRLRAAPLLDIHLPATLSGALRPTKRLFVHVARQAEPGIFAPPPPPACVHLAIQYMVGRQRRQKCLLCGETGKEGRVHGSFRTGQEGGEHG